MLGFLNILELNGYPVRKARDKYLSIQQASNPVTVQEKAKKEILDFHSRHNEFYFKEMLHGKEGLEWHQIPIITKTDLGGEYLTKIPKAIRHQKLYSGLTSGTSGPPVAFARDRLHHALVWLDVERHYAQSEVSLNDRQARFYCVPAHGKWLYKEKVKDILANRHRFVVNGMTEKTLSQWLKVFRHRRFDYLYGYAQSLYTFAKYVHMNNVTLKELCPSLKTCIVTSEMCSDEEQAFISSAFGVPVANEYGISEVGVIGYKTANFWECSDELFYLEVIDDEGTVLPDGASGRLLCTCLYNLATPFIRYEVGDMVTLDKSNGRTRITKLDGRVADQTVLPSGKMVHGLTFYYIVDDIVKYLSGVKEYRVVQYEREKFYVEIVGDVVISANDQSNLRKVFEDYLEPGLEVDFRRVDHIERTSSGKFKPFVSLV